MDIAFNLLRLIAFSDMLMCIGNHLWVKDTIFSGRFGAPYNVGKEVELSRN